MVGPILEALERKIELRRDATRAPLRAPEWQRATSMPRPPRNTQISTRPRLTYCGPKLVLTKGSTLDHEFPDRQDRAPRRVLGDPPQMDSAHCCRPPVSSSPFRHVSLGLSRV